MSEMYEYKVALFENGKLEVLLLFIRYLLKMIKATGATSEIENIQYFCILIHGEVLR